MNTLHHFWFVWVWPSIRGNGPEDATATAGLAVATALVWPPARRAIHRFADRKVSAIKDHVTVEHRKARDVQAELHRKLDHIIKHSPGIPDLPDEP